MLALNPKPRRPRNVSSLNLKASGKDSNSCKLGGSLQYHDPSPIRLKINSCNLPAVCACARQPVTMGRDYHVSWTFIGLPSKSNLGQENTSLFLILSHKLLFLLTSTLCTLNYLRGLVDSSPLILPPLYIKCLLSLSIYHFISQQYRAPL